FTSLTYCSLLFFHTRVRAPPISALFPYTTLFRSVDYELTARIEDDLDEIAAGQQQKGDWLQRFYFGNGDDDLPGLKRLVEENLRSEEHTSELQSRENLVCRLLLEKKKKKR